VRLGLESASWLFELARVLVRLDHIAGQIVKLFVADVVMRAMPHTETVILQQLRGGVVVIVPAHAGNLFVMVLDNTDPNAASTIYKFAPNGTQSTFGAVPGQGFGLAFDGAGNLYAADAVDRIIYKFTTDGTRTVFASMTNAGPVGLAFDQAGNLFVSTEVNPGSDTIFKFTPDGTQSTFAMGLNTPRGLAFNRGGILFVAEIIQTGPGDILRFTPSGSGNVFASGIGPGGNGGPEYLAVQLPTKPH
jgi:hypothetical protein